MKKILLSAILILSFLSGEAQTANALLGTQSARLDSMPGNFMFIDSTFNGNLYRIRVAKTSWLRLKPYNMKWWSDSTNSRLVSYMKTSIAIDSMNAMKITINGKLAKSDTAGHWKPIGYVPSWSQVTGKPSFSNVAITGSYNDLSGQPSLSVYYLASNPSGYISSVPAQSWSSITGKPSFATVAISGSYADLTGAPSIPAAQVNSDWNSVSGVSQILNKPTIATTTSALTNNSGFITASSSDLLTNKTGNISQWTNNSGYLTSVPAQSFISLTGKPSTLSGYGITDAYPLTGNPSNFLTSFTETDPTFNTKFSAKSTTDLTEGTRLYYTDTRARASVSLTTTGSGAASYNSTTGVLNVPTPSASGTVTSVGLSSSDFTVSGSPVTTSGNIAANLNTSGVSAGTYNAAYTVNNKGIITSASSKTQSIVVRSLNTGFQVSTTKAADVNYSILVSLTSVLLGSASGTVQLQISADNVTYNTAATSGFSLSGVVATASNTQTLSAFVPMGYYVKILYTGANTGIATSNSGTYQTGQEILY